MRPWTAHLEFADRLDKTMNLLSGDALLQWLLQLQTTELCWICMALILILTTCNYEKLLTRERALLSALQSGAFISASEHAKFDVSKPRICPICQQEDDREHWLYCPRFQHLRQAIRGWFPDNVQLPPCVIFTC